MKKHDQVVSRDPLIDNFKILELISLPGYVDASFAFTRLESQQAEYQHQSHLWWTIWPWAKQPKKCALKPKMQWVRWGWGRKGKTKKEAGLRHVRGLSRWLIRPSFHRGSLGNDRSNASISYKRSYPRPYWIRIQVEKKICSFKWQWGNKEGKSSSVIA